MEKGTAGKKGKKIVKGILIAGATLIILLAIALFILFGGEISTLLTIQQPDKETAFFTMEYKGDYGFDKFLETGASNDQELIHFITKQLLKGIPVQFSIPNLGCSTFSVENPEGQQLFARNFDLGFSPAMLVKTTPKNGYSSYSMVNLAFIGFGKEKLPTNLTNSFMALAAPYAPLDGVNEKGLAIGVLLIDTTPTNQQTSKVDITTTTAIRMVLDKCATVEEALTMLNQYDMHASANSSYHFHIADASGKSVVVEYIGDTISIVESPMATNFLLTEGDWDFGGGQDRFATLKQTIEEANGILTEQQSMDLLASVQQNNAEKNMYTQWSVVYNQTTGEVDISIAKDYEKKFTYSLAS